MRDFAIKKIVDDLLKRGEALQDMVALDFFAREGDWQTKYYSSFVSKIHAWEIEEKFEEKLRKNLPNANIIIGDSFELAKTQNQLFDIIVLDNPQGCFGENQKYCEHFEAIDVAISLLKPLGGILIFNVKTQPFDYESKLEWKQKRNTFYKVEDASFLSKDFLLEFYNNFFQNKNLKIEYSYFVERPQEQNLYAFVAKVSTI